MATRKKGVLTTSPEWARHLRPELKRLFWRGERNAESRCVNDETRAMYVTTVEELQAEIEAWNVSASEQRLYVARYGLRFTGETRRVSEATQSVHSMCYQNRELPSAAAMAIVLNSVLAAGYQPDGCTHRRDGLIYHYRKL